MDLNNQAPNSDASFGESASHSPPRAFAASRESNHLSFRWETYHLFDDLTRRREDAKK
jgi:hypothetical protein